MIVLFLCQLCSGCLAMTGLCRTDHVSWRYFRLMQRVALGLLLAAGVFVATVPNWREEPVLRRAAAAIAVSAIVVVVGLTTVGRNGDSPQRSRRTIGWLGAACTLIAAASLASPNGPLVSQAWPRASPEYVSESRVEIIGANGSTTITAVSPPAEPRGARSPAGMSAALAPAWISAALGAGVLGAVTAGMLLGHSYLTHVTMPIDPLRRLTSIVAVMVLLKSAWAAVNLAASREWLNVDGPQATWLWLMLGLRIGVGLLGLGVLAYMIRDCVRLRNTQSATGILFIAMVFAFLGELSSAELGRAFGVWV
ncbi:MAG: hypothetical protein HUU22_06780 [Phycisphaerae bacterium]|nr:hypothetical protein [Phycisphaerae bacterium]NUQ45719.1 hypothetical protein [Phycisphaerae bacterium]